MLPDNALTELSTDTATAVTMGTSYVFDFAGGDFQIKDGRLVKAAGETAFRIWITKILKTEKYRYKIYARDDKNEYGVTVTDLLVGCNYPPEFAESEIKREITDALLKNPLIGSLSAWSITRDGAAADIAFTVNLADGTATETEVTI